MQNGVNMSNMLDIKNSCSKNDPRNSNGGSSGDDEKENFDFTPGQYILTKNNEFGQIINVKLVGGKIKIEINELAMLGDVVQQLEENQNEKNNKLVKYFVKEKAENKELINLGISKYIDFNDIQKNVDIELAKDFQEMDAK